MNLWNSDLENVRRWLLSTGFIVGRAGTHVVVYSEMANDFARACVASHENFVNCSVCLNLKYHAPYFKDYARGESQRGRAD